jgi:nitroreductase
MEVFDAVRTVLAVREYRPDAVPDELVRRIVEAGRLTASSQNRQPWHFVVVQDKAILRALGESIRSGPYIADAPLAIAILVDKQSRFGDSDASRAAQSMILTAWSEGVGSNWVGFHGMDRAAEILGVPEQYSLFAILPFGYPLNPVGKGNKKRKPLSEVASRGRFGESF